jgi:AmmeMemoRadiSam system protein B/AmmeMemoRadiSam system protein A
MQLKIIITCIFTLFIYNTCASIKDVGEIRPAMVAGSFYPADPAELKTTVDFFISNANSTEIHGQIKAIIVPHAGYIFSGPVAARAYACLKGQNINRVIIISPSHIASFEGASVYNGKAYETPLGKVPVDIDFAKELTKKSRYIYSSSKGHNKNYRGRGEHAIEVQLPFLQRVLNEFKIVPIVMGDQQYETCRALGLAQAELIHDNKTLIIASSDLSHYHSYEEAKNLDTKFIQSVQDWDYFNLSRNLQTGVCEACGGGPVIAAMIASEAMGADEAKLLKYANSGDTPAGEKSRVVGYAAMALIETTDSVNKKGLSFSLKESEQNRLLNIARQAVEMKVKGNNVFSLDQHLEPGLLEDRGAFVTLEINGHLRGCIGYTSPVKPLAETVRDAAIQAATGDPRFRPVSEEELPLLHYSISVLSSFNKITPEKIIIGTHGLLIRKGNNAGLLLPQVAIEQNWDRETFLEHTCQKAGLPNDAWKDADTDIFGFTAFVFGE